MVLYDANHLVPRLRMSVDIPTVPHMPSWYAQGQLCLYLTFNFTFSFTFTFASKEHFTWEKYVANVGTFETCMLQSLTHYLHYVLYMSPTTEDRVGFRETLKIKET
jgi:hypothetical protein